MKILSYRNHKSKGFTLMEVLIAIAVTSFLLTALYATFFLSQKAISSIDDSLIRLQETRTALDILKREIESAFYAKEKGYSIFKLQDRDFYGRSTSNITFTTFSPVLAGLAKISYTVEEVDGKLILKKAIASAFSSKSQSKEFELIEDIHSFTIEARFKDNWVKTWDSSITYRLPEEVRIKITFTEKSKGDKENSQKTHSVFDIAKPVINRTL